MSDGTISLPWLVIRQDDNGNRYRVGRYPTRAEAQKIADSLDRRGHKQLYWVEHIGQTQTQASRNADGTRN
ncbi:SPOR domain-containing protein [Streptomyces sp. NPDC018693]|uniref:SPOR domain-containing protein n=1 Tax=unclassified Streptomyces TaxID=2593676 RepID=UPI00379CFC09